MARITTSRADRPTDLLAGLQVKQMIGVPTSAGVMSTQLVAGAAGYFYAGEVVTNIIVCVQVAGAGTAPSNINLSLWSSAATPVCLAVTAELGADARWTTQGWKVCALSSPYTIPSSGMYYPAFWINGTFASTNMQLVYGQGGAGAASNQIGSGVRPYTILKSAVTSMAVNDTGTYAQGGAIPLFAVS